MSVMLQLSLSSAVRDDGQSPFESAVTGIASVLLLPLAFPSQRHLPHAWATLHFPLCYDWRSRCHTLSLTSQLPVEFRLKTDQLSVFSPVIDITVIYYNSDWHYCHLFLFQFHCRSFSSTLFLFLFFVAVMCLYFQSLCRAFSSAYSPFVAVIYLYILSVCLYLQFDSTVSLFVVVILRYCQSLYGCHFSLGLPSVRLFWAVIICLSFDWRCLSVTPVSYTHLTLPTRSTV